MAIPHGTELFRELDPEPSNPTSFKLSQLGQLLSGQIKLTVPVYTVYGPVEDIRVLEKFRTGEYEVPNLLVLDESNTRSLDIGGIKLRLLGLGGGLQMHKMFDIGEGTATIAGGNGTIWLTALQIGELMDSAHRVHDPTETRVLVTHGAIGREGLLTQLAIALRADLTVSGALHFRNVGSFNEFGVHSDPEAFRAKLIKSRNAFMDVYESAKAQLDSSSAPDQKEYLAKAVEVAQKVPSLNTPAPSATEPQNGDAAAADAHWKNCWNWSLSEAAFGHVVLIVKDGRVSSETHSQGLNFGYRRYLPPASQQPPQRSVGTGETSKQAPTAGPVVNGRNVSGTRKGPVPAQTSSTVNTPKSTEKTNTDTLADSSAKTSEPAAAATIPASGQSGRPERKNFSRLERSDLERGSSWSRPSSGQDAQDRKKPRNGKNLKERDATEGAGNETSRSSPSERKPVNPRAAATAATAPEAAKRVGEEINKADSSNAKPDITKSEDKQQPSTGTEEATGTAPKSNGETRISTRPALNPHTLYLKGLPSEVTHEQLKSIWDESIRAKVCFSHRS